MINNFLAREISQNNCVEKVEKFVPTSNLFQYYLSSQTGEYLGSAEGGRESGYSTEGCHSRRSTPPNRQLFLEQRSPWLPSGHQHHQRVKCQQNANILTAKPVDGSSINTRQKQWITVGGGLRKPRQENEHSNKPNLSTFASGDVLSTTTKGLQPATAYV